MGLFENIFKGKSDATANNKYIKEYFKTLNAYTPVFTTYDGGVYEALLTRAAIHTIATQCAKLKPEIKGDVYKELGNILQYKTSEYMDTYKFLYRTSTILNARSNAFIVPIYENDLKTICGLYPVIPQRTELIQHNGVPWVRYTFANGKRGSIEFSKAGLLTQYQYKDDFFGDSNTDVLKGTLNLMNIQEQGMIDAIKQSAILRFIGRLSTNLRDEDILKERERFSKENLSYENDSGLMLVDGRFSDIKQLENKQFLVDAEQMKLIQTNIYNFYGVNEDILQNKFTEDQWNAFYESKIEPFAIQLGLVLTKMLFTDEEIKRGSQVYFSSNRLQYASNNTKLEISTKLFDRAILSRNQVNEIWNMAPVEGGDKRFIRLDYIDVDLLDNTELVEKYKKLRGSKEGEEGNVKE